MRRLIGLILIMIICFPLSSLTLDKEGYGETREEAKTDAAAELSRYLYSSVDTTTVTTLFDSGSEYEASYLNNTEIRSQMPLLGVSYTYRYSNGYYISVAHMDSEISLPMYYLELDSFIDELSMPDLEGMDSIEAAGILNTVLRRFEEYRKLVCVVAALGGSYEKTPITTENAIRTALSKINGTVDSMKKAAFVLTQGCECSGIFIEQPLPLADSVASDFSILLANALSGVLGGKTVSDMKNASHFMSTRYSEDQNGDLFVTVGVEDCEGVNVFSSSVTVPRLLIEGVEIYADGYDFRKAMNTGESVANEFQVFIRVNGGNMGDTFSEGDELFIEVKASRPCYYYIVGYVFNEEGAKFSYLFPLSVYDDGKDMFVGRVSSENVGKWIVINPMINGEVVPLEIMPPYGVETLQVYASTTTDHNDFLSKIPTWTETEDFYLVSGDPEAVLSRTRALNIKKASSNKKETFTSESSVTYRSVPWR